MYHIKNQRRLFLVSGTVGAGKTTICRQLIENNSNDLDMVVSTTTRPQREGEIDGVDYNFVSVALFLKDIEKNKFTEINEVYGNLYGYSIKDLERIFQSGKDAIFIIDVVGADKMRHAYRYYQKYGYCDCEFDLVSIFIAPPSIENTIERMHQRGTENTEAIEIRTNAITFEIEEIQKYDYCITNVDLEESVNLMKSIIQAEKIRIRPNSIYR